MSSRVRSGKSVRISSSLIPPARYSRTSYTVILVPLTHGLPLRTAGFIKIRSCQFMRELYLVVGMSLGSGVLPKTGSDLTILAITRAECSTHQRLHWRRVHRLVSRLGFGGRRLLGFLDASHFLSEIGLSPERLPSSKPATVRSSSRSGQ